MSSGKWRPSFLGLNVLTHWGQVMHICVSKLTIIASDSGLSPDQRQAIIWTSAGILLIGPLGRNFNAILIKVHIFSFRKIHFKMWSVRFRPFCLGLNVLTCFNPWSHKKVSIPRALFTDFLLQSFFPISIQHIVIYNERDTFYLCLYLNIWSSFFFQKVCFVFPLYKSNLNQNQFLHWHHFSSKIVQPNFRFAIISWEFLLQKCLETDVKDIFKHSGK